MKYSFIILLSVAFLFSCNSKSSNESSVDWGETQEHYLNGKGVSIKLPGTFILSSRYRIKQDLPALNNKSAAASIIEDALADYERKDPNINVFVDTSSQYRFVTILNSEEKIALDKSSAARLGKVLMEDYKKMDLSKRGVEVSRIESNIKNNNYQKLAKFKFEIKDKRKKKSSYVTSFFVTNNTRTLILHEFSDSKEDLEFFTWSLSENY